MPINTFAVDITRPRIPAPQPTETYVDQATFDAIMRTGNLSFLVPYQANSGVVTAPPETTYQPQVSEQTMPITIAPQYYGQTNALVVDPATLGVQQERLLRDFSSSFPGDIFTRDAGGVAPLSNINTLTSDAGQSRIVVTPQVAVVPLVTNPPVGNTTTTVATTQIPQPTTTTPVNTNASAQPSNFDFGQSVTRVVQDAASYAQDYVKDSKNWKVLGMGAAVLVGFVMFGMGDSGRRRY